MPVDLPYVISAGTLARAQEVYQNLLALKQKFDAGIVNADMSAACAMYGTKLYAGSDDTVKIPTAAIKDYAIVGGSAAGSKISTAKTIVQANLALLSVGTPELIDASVTLAKMGLASVGGSQLVVGSWSNPSLISLNSGQAADVSTGLVSDKVLASCIQYYGDELPPQGSPPNVRYPAIFFKNGTGGDNRKLYIQVNNFTPGSVAVHAGDINFNYILLP